MKEKILNKLRAEKEVVYGEDLSSRLGVSRVSVWKHIKKLQEVGYSIEATPKGYVLTGTPDVLYPWEFGDRASKIHYFDAVDSTMNIARDLARNQCPHFTVVIAGRQEKGKGRLKRTWRSSEGGLYFTIVVRPDMPPALSSRINFAASMVLAQTLQSRFDVHAAVKWPNDILVDGKKLAGILSELDAETDRVNFINIGIGINVNNDPTPYEPTAVSLTQILGKPVERRELLKVFLDGFEHTIDDANLVNVVSQWKRYTQTLNRQVKIVTTREVAQGLAVDVDDDGALILKMPDGSLKRIIYGDCFHE